MDAQTAEAVKWQVMMNVSVYKPKSEIPAPRRQLLGEDYDGRLFARKSFTMSQGPNPWDTVECLGKLVSIEKCACEYGDIANLECYCIAEDLTMREAVEQLIRDGWKIVGWNKA